MKRTRMRMRKGVVRRGGVDLVMRIWNRSLRMGMIGKKQGRRVLICVNVMSCLDGADMLEAGEAHEETLFETTCTLYETDPATSSWVSKGTGVIHVNVDKDS